MATSSTQELSRRRGRSPMCLRVVSLLYNALQAQAYKMQDMD